MTLTNTLPCDLGWKAKDFQLLNTIDHKMYNMTEQIGSKGLLLAFICNHCPYVQTMIERFVKDANILIENGINVLSIMSNDYEEYPEDNPENMKLFAAKNNFTFPYLIDPSQNTAKDYNAVCTPDFFGFNNNFELQYRGRLDNIKMSSSTERTAELLNSMLEIANNGTCSATQHPSIGCSIKWKTSI